jgi:uncharacterized membrane protein YtjA (UPF0391 family)
MGHGGVTRIGLAGLCKQMEMVLVVLVMVSLLISNRA